MASAPVLLWLCSTCLLQYFHLLFCNALLCSVRGLRLYIVQASLCFGRPVSLRWVLPPQIWSRVDEHLDVAVIVVRGQLPQLLTRKVIQKTTGRQRILLVFRWRGMLGSGFARPPAKDSKDCLQQSGAESERFDGCVGGSIRIATAMSRPNLDSLLLSSRCLGDSERCPFCCRDHSSRRPAARGCQVCSGCGCALDSLTGLP